MTIRRSLYLLVTALVVLVASLWFARGRSSADDSADSAPGAVATAAGAAASAAAAGRSVTGTEVLVYKSPACGCCSKWVDHLEEFGFTVRTEDVADLRPLKVENGITPELASCHTAVVDGYVIEGHVPADVIARLLDERPDVRGLAVPGMPIGSPGMEGVTNEPYEILAFDGDGRTSVYATR